MLPLACLLLTGLLSVPATPAAPSVGEDPALACFHGVALEEGAPARYLRMEIRDDGTFEVRVNRSTVEGYWFEQGGRVAYLAPGWTAWGHISARSTCGRWECSGGARGVFRMIRTHCPCKRPW